jgi:hypothetical protein
LASLGIPSLELRLNQLAAGAGGAFSAQAGTGEEKGYDAVVLATGGLVGGGVAFHADRVPSFVPGLQDIGVVGLHGRPIEVGSSAFGMVGEELDLSTHGGRDRFTRIGLIADAGGRLLDRTRTPIPRLFGAGDLLADRPRCLGEVIDSGLVAGTAAAEAM